MLTPHLSLYTSSSYYLGNMVCSYYTPLLVQSQEVAFPSVQNVFGHIPTSVLLKRLTSPLVITISVSLICHHLKLEGDLTGSLHFPSEHTQHYHLISPHYPTGSLDSRYPCRWHGIDFPLFSHSRQLILPLCFTLSHLGLLIRLRVSRFSASPSDITLQ
jgi:hypothetical protein